MAFLIAYCLQFLLDSWNSISNIYNLAMAYINEMSGF